MQNMQYSMMGPDYSYTVCTLYKTFKIITKLARL